MKTLILHPTAIASVILLSSLFHVEPILGDGCPAPAFVSPRTFETRGGSSSLAVGDFNGDGQPDLAVANFDSDDVSILLGKGDGDFQSAVTYRTGVHPVFVAVGDLNGDGRTDLVVADAGSFVAYMPRTGGSLSVLLGNGDGTFQAAVNYAVRTYPQSVAVGDFNGDGKPDLAVANRDPESIYTGGNVRLLLGKRDGNFQPAAIYDAAPD